MSKKTLVIDGPDPEHFFLAVGGDTLRVGDEPAHAEGVVRGLRVVRIRCEVEFEDDRDTVPLDGTGGADPQPLGPGSVVHLGHADLALVESPAAVGPEPGPAPPPAPPGTAVRRRLRVIDGADQGKVFNLPDDGAVTIADFIDLASNFNTNYAGEIWPMSWGDQAMLDAFAAANVPEPGTIALLFTGIGAIVARRRLRNQA